LGKIGRIDILETLASALVIPEQVAEEIRAGNEHDAARQWILAEGVKYLIASREADAVIAAWDLGAGESAVLAFARQNPQYEALLDDRAARNCASTLQIPVRGTVGIVLLAKQQKLVHEARPLLEALLQVGLRIYDNSLAYAIRLAGEE
jgi:predicted nucleic acid-binding protein